MKKIAVCLAFLLFFSLVMGQDPSDTENQTQQPKQKNLSIIPLPVIAYNPTNAWMFGLAPGASWFMGDPESTSI